MPDTPQPIRRFTLASWLSIYGRGSYEDFVKESDYAALEAENARLRCGLDLIRINGGKTTDEGVSCNGSWCAEQARATLNVT